MSKTFQDIKVGDQLELPHGRSFWAAYERQQGKSTDPDRPVAVMVVTHRWFDPYERKEYVALASMRSDGTWDADKPMEKWTITGLARNGYRYATRDWRAFVQECREAEKSGKLVKLRLVKK